MSIEPGSSFGPYRIKEPLGRGGMATVFRAHDATLERDIALKVMPPQFLHDETFGERFEREAKVIARLEHPHIVPIYAFGIEEQTPWMAMRLVSGGSVSGLVESGAVEPERAMPILRGVAEALDYAHGKGIVHRDVKPSNILLDDAGRVYLADFGIARLLESSSFVTRSGLVTGTPQYMAPEQARSEKADHLSDIYSFAVVAYQLFTGRVPFTGEAAVNVLMKHVMDPVPVPDPEQVPPAVSDVLLRGLAKEPAHRWPTATGFVDALEAALAGEHPVTVTAVQPDGAVPAAPAPQAAPSPPGGPDTAAATDAQDAGFQVPLPFAVIGIVGIAAFALFVWMRRARETAPDALPPPSTTPAAATPRRLPPAEAEPGAVWTNPQDGMEYVFIPPTAGFEQGCVPGDDACAEDETPRRRVALTRGYWLGRTEVTVASYRRFVEAVGRQLPRAPQFNLDWSDETQPVVRVDWPEAATYCEWAGGRLPTEAEWERAARGDLEGRLFPWGGAPPVCTPGAEHGARFDDDGECGEGTPGPVALFAPNPFGLHDVSGNVWEWCADWYGGRYYADAPDTDPRGPPDGSRRVMRGGAANSSTRALRLSHRNHFPPRSTSVNVGFRCALDPPLP